MTEKLLCQYKKVFNEDGTVKACGRYECIKLISLCEEHANNKNHFGSTDTGFMDVNAIKKYINNL
jgi:hypothetical protein